jgi:hypothetical protein
MSMRWVDRAHASATHRAAALLQERLDGQQPRGPDLLLEIAQLLEVAPDFLPDRHVDASLPRDEDALAVKRQLEVGADQAQHVRHHRPGETCLQRMEVGARPRLGDLARQDRVQQLRVVGEPRAQPGMGRLLAALEDHDHQQGQHHQEQRRGEQRVQDEMVEEGM